MQSHFDQCVYTDSDFAGLKSDTKSTWGACFFLRSCFVSCMYKKKSSIALSIDEENYILAGLGCTQILWMQHALKDYGLEMKRSSFYCDSTNASSITRNLVLHFKTKHIEVKKGISTSNTYPQSNNLETSS